MQNNPKVSIIIPCRNEEKTIARTLSSIYEQEYDSEIEILVCDGLSHDNTVNIVNKFFTSILNKPNSFGAKVSGSIITNHRKTAACGMNIGFRAATGEVLIVISAHSYIASDFIKENLACLAGDVDVAGGLILSAPDSPSFIARSIGYALNTRFALGGITARTGDCTRPMNNPSFGAYKKEIFEKFGYFDEGLIRNSDYVYNMHIVKNGAKIMFSPKIKSYYFNRSNLIALFKQYFLSSYYKAALLKTHKGIVFFRHLIPTFAVLFGLALLACSFFSPVAMYGLLALSALYILLSFVYGLKKPAYMPLLPLIYFILHTSYGLGFIFGFISFILLGKDPYLKTEKI